MTVNTDALGQAIANQQERMLADLLDDANETIAELRQDIAERDSLIGQYARMVADARVNYEKAMLSLKDELKTLRQRVGVQAAMDYAQDCARTAAYQR